MQISITAETLFFSFSAGVTAEKVAANVFIALHERGQGMRIPIS
jgi:hypothetical protein